MLDLDTIKARAEVATEGPWFSDDRRAKVYNRVGEIAWCRDLIERGQGAYAIGGQNTANGRFIAHAREDVPALIAEVERLRAENNLLHREREEARENRPRPIARHYDDPAIPKRRD